MALQQLRSDDIKTGRYEFIDSMLVGDSWMLHGADGEQWLDNVINEDAPAGSMYYVFGGETEYVLGSPVTYSEVFFYKDINKTLDPQPSV